MSQFSTLATAPQRHSPIFNESDKKHNQPPEQPSVETVPYYHNKANYMMNNTFNLPVNKGVPFHILDKICEAVKYITKMDKRMWIILKQVDIFCWISLFFLMQ